MNRKTEVLLKKEKINNHAWLNLTLKEIPKELLILDIRIFYFFFNNLFKILNSSEKIKQNILIFVKDIYLALLEESIKGKMNEILIDDIKNSEKEILKFIASPKEFLKNNINTNFHKIMNRENLISENENKINDMKLEYNNKIDIIFNNNFNIPLLFPEKKICSINYDQIELDSSLLSIPIIANINDEIKSNYRMINVQVTTPFLNHFYSEPIILNIMSYVEEDIKAEIKGLSYYHKEEFEKRSPK